LTRPIYLFICLDTRQENKSLCLKKVPTFELSVTLSNLNRFSKFLHCWKAYEICYNMHTDKICQSYKECKMETFLRHSVECNTTDGQVSKTER